MQASDSEHAASLPTSSAVQLELHSHMVSNTQYCSILAKRTRCCGQRSHLEVKRRRIYSTASGQLRSSGRRQRQATPTWWLVMRFLWRGAADQLEIKASVGALLVSTVAALSKHRDGPCVSVCQRHDSSSCNLLVVREMQSGLQEPKRGAQKPR